MVIRKATLSLGSVVIILLAAVAFAVPQQGLLDRAAVIEAGKTVTRAEYPNADDVLLDDYILARYEPDGTAEVLDDTFIKVLTEKGKREAQSMTFHFLLPFSTVDVLLVEIIKPDGTVVPVDVEAQSKVMVNPNQMSKNIYNPNSKMLKVGAPGLEVGDILRYFFKTNIVKPRVSDTWSEYQVFEYSSPIKRYVFEVHQPKDLPLKNIILKDEQEGTVTITDREEGDRLIRRWEITDVPRIYEEPDMPPYHTVVQRLLLSTVETWEDLSRWYWDLSAPHLESVTPEMRELVAELTEGVTDDMEKIRAIFRWVSQEVRYMGITIEKDAPGYEPHDVQLTFEARHGVCRDKAALLVAMLRLAGLEAYPVLIHAGPKKDEEVPQPFFNHAVSAVQLVPGEYVLMDSTDENTKELFPSYLDNCSYLVARPEGEKLLTSPIVPAEENMMFIETAGRIDADGNLSAHTTLDFNGINDNIYRGYFARVSPTQRRELFESVVKRVAPGARLNEIEITPANIMDTTEPLAITLDYEADDVVVGDGATAMLPVFRMATNVGMANFILGKTGLNKRRFPLKTDTACGVHETFSYEIDPALGALAGAPQYTPVDNESVLWRIDVEDRTDAIAGVSEFMLKGVEFSPEQYLQLKQDLKEIEYNARKMALMTRNEHGQTDFGPAEAVILQHDTSYELTDAHNWVKTLHAKIKVLTYKGKKDNGELSISYNPTWHEVELIKAQVTNGDQVKEISEEEKNIMDARWVGEAPRYPAGKTLVASLPGVEIGSIIEYSYKVTYTNHPFFSATETFRRYDPIVSKSVTVSAPADLDLKIAFDQNGLAVPDELCEGPGPLQYEETSSGKSVVHRWRVADQPPIKRERSLPPAYAYNPVLRVTAGNWRVHADRLNAALQAAATEQTAAIEKARELTDGLTDEGERIQAVRDFIAKNIRSAGPALTSLPFSSITPADTTLVQGYGNTSDRAVLLYAMLAAVCDETPDFILTTSTSRVDPLQRFQQRYPGRRTFGKVLVGINVAGESILLNDTDQYAALGASYSDGFLGMMLPHGEIDVLRVPDDKINQRTDLYNMSIDGQGHCRIATAKPRRGTTYGIRNKLFAEMPPEERNRFYQELVASIAQAAQADGDLQTDFDEYPGNERFVVDVPRYGVRDGEHLYFKIPMTLGGLLPLRSDTRDNPFYRGATTRLTVKTVIDLPAGFDEIVIAPAEQDYVLPDNAGRVDISSEYDEDARQLTIIHKARLTPAVIAADNYGEMLEMHRQLSHAEAATVLLRKTQ